MIIEFAGISGSGKTTVFQKLYKRLKTCGVDIVRFHHAAKRFGLTPHKATELFRDRHPGLIEAIKGLSDGPSYEMRNAALARHVWISGHRALDVAGDNAVGMIDEGYLHRCAYIASKGKGYMSFSDILPKLPRPDVLVHVHIPLEEARRRFVFRMPTPERRAVAALRFDRRYSDHRHVRDFFEDAKSVYSKHGVAVHMIDNSGEVDSEIDALAHGLLNQVSDLRVAS